MTRAHTDAETLHEADRWVPTGRRRRVLESIPGHGKRQVLMLEVRLRYGTAEQWVPQAAWAATQQAANAIRKAATGSAV